MEGKKIWLILGISIFIILVFVMVQPKILKEEEQLDFLINNSIENEVIGYKYIEDGISIQISLLNVVEPKLILLNGKNVTQYELENIFDHDYKADIPLKQLKNGDYSMLVKDGGVATQLINKLDLLEQLVRSKVGDKLITFHYTDNFMTFTVEDFNYQYDILIDPGHGGIDAGTTNSVMNEADFNLLQSLYEKKRYEDHGLTVLLARENDEDGMLMGSKEWNRAKQRGYAIGYYGVTSKIVYSNHHNSTANKNTSGFEILVSNTLNRNNLEIELSIIDDLKEKYPSSLRNNAHMMYSRDYETGMTYTKEEAKVYSYRDYYATIRIPLELFNVKTVTYEGCYMSNKENFDWYYNQEGWKIMSEVKIKNYVESLGKTYIPI